MISASEDEDDADVALDGLSAFVSGLDAGTKRKAADRDDVDGPDNASAGADAQRPRKRRIIHERTQAGVESEFAARATGAGQHLSIYSYYALTVDP